MGGVQKEDEGKGGFPYNQGSTGLFVLLALLMFGAYQIDATELMGGFYFGLLIIYRVVLGLVIKRHFWHWPDEAVGFYSLLTAFVLSAGFLALLMSNAPEGAAGAPHHP